MARNNNNGNGNNGRRASNGNGRNGKNGNNGRKGETKRKAIEYVSGKTFDEVQREAMRKAGAGDI